MNRLKELRKEKKLTQKALAEKLKIPYRTIQNWENEDVQIKPDKAKQLADYFKVTVGYLLGYTNLGVGSRLKQLRLNSGLTIEKVCNDLKIEDLDYWKLWETQDNITFGKELAQEIADYFSVDVNYLLGKTNIVNTNFSSIEQMIKNFYIVKNLRIQSIQLKMMNS
ncbi:helix-turn-helix domain-containing protein [Streptococcus uberis]|nr:helix-turn-helix transcriptional regulator [Streptococcus uberis]MCK1196572.1 helix-turn-helix domain-containing protein [Streptococcus uberis]